jgi:hypothetical protein
MSRRPTVKAHELYSAVDPALVTQMLDWFRANDRNVYKSAVATLAGNRKLRPVFIEKKPLAEQYAWIHKTLKLNACNTIGEHLLQAYLMAGQQSMLAMFCDGMGIPHDGKGSVVGDLPKNSTRNVSRKPSTASSICSIPSCSRFTSTASTCRSPAAGPPSARSSKATSASCSREVFFPYFSFSVSFPKCPKSTSGPTAAR